MPASPSRNVTASVLQLSWHAGQRRVRLYCAEELRPSACCIVDALHTRGYEVSLFTGPEARSHLRLGAGPEYLRVVWAPEVPDRVTRDRLRDGLDPEAQGDVLVLGATTPRGVIDAIDAFGAPPRRPRRRAQHPRRTYLAHPTLVERSLEHRGYCGGLLAGAAIVVALLAGLSLGARDAPSGAPNRVAVVVPDTAADGRGRMRDEPVLAASMTRPGDTDEQDEDEDEDEDIIILDDEEPAPRPRARPREQAVAAHAPVEIAPLERPSDDHQHRPSLLPAALAASGGVVNGAPGAGSRPVAAPSTIDPF